MLSKNWQSSGIFTRNPIFSIFSPFFFVQKMTECFWKKHLLVVIVRELKEDICQKKLIRYMNCYILECTQLWWLFWVLVIKFAMHRFASIPWMSLFLCTFETYIIILWFAITRMLWIWCGTISFYFCWIFPLGVSNIVFSCMHGHFYNWFSFLTGQCTIKFAHIAYVFLFTLGPSIPSMTI